MNANFYTSRTLNLMKFIVTAHPGSFKLLCGVVAAQRKHLSSSTQMRGNLPLHKRSTMMSQLPTKKYLGNCHCGIFKSELEVPEIKTVSACKCSLCNKKGYLFVSPTREHFKIFSGEGKLIRYEFADKKSSHEVCHIVQKRFSVC